MSPRKLAGHPTRSVTDYVYEGDRLVRSVTTHEPEFTQQDTNYLLALMALDADIGPHGFPMSEAMDRANEKAFEVGLPSIDHAARAIGLAQDAYYKQWPDEPRHGHQWSARRKSAAE